MENILIVINQFQYRCTCITRSLANSNTSEIRIITTAGKFLQPRKQHFGIKVPGFPETELREIRERRRRERVSEREGRLSFN